MFDIAICNDSINELDYLDHLLDVYRRKHPWPVVRVRRFQSLYDLVDCIRAGRTFSLYILGHRGELWMNNLSPEAVLRRAESRGEIIVLTSSRATTLTPAAADPLRLAAILARPVGPVGDRYLYQVLDRLIAAERDKDGPLQPCLTFPVSSPREKLSLPYEKISCLRYERHIVTCWLADGSSVPSSSLRKPFYQLIRPLLLEARFTQVSSSWVINFDYVERITRKPPEIQMADGCVIKVPADAIDGTLEEYEQYRSQPGKKRGEPIGRGIGEEN